MHPSRISACIGVGLALLLPSGVTGSSTVHAQVVNVSVTQALDRYEQGDRAVLGAIARIENGAALYLNLEKYGLKWAKAAGDAAKPRRLLIMAAFALEAAGNSSVSTTTALQLIELGCDRLRPPYGPAQPLPAERLWHRAALGVLEAKGNYMSVMAHLWHLNRRFKDDPHAMLALYDSLAAALIRQRAPDRGELVVAFSDGIDTTSAMSVKKLEQVASRSEAVLHAFIVRSPELVELCRNSINKRSMAVLCDQSDLKRVAESTGGRLYETLSGNHIPQGLSRALDEFRTSYTLRYALSGVPRPGWHDIKVKVTRAAARGATIRARRGYFGG